MLAEEIAEPLDAGHRFLHQLRSKRQRLPVVAGDQVEHHRLAAVAVERLGELEDVVLRLRHLRIVDFDHTVVHPYAGEGPAGGAGLRDLVLMVGEDEV